MIKQENKWRINKIQQRQLHNEKGHESNSYTGSNNFKRNKAKRQEISTRFQNFENHEESDHMQQELYYTLSNPEFQELMLNPDFEDYYISKMGKSFGSIHLKKQEPRQNTYTPPIKKQVRVFSNILTTGEQQIKEEAQSVNPANQSEQPMIGEVSEWPVQYDYPIEPRYELKLSDIPDDNYEYDDMVEEDNFFGCMF